MKANRYHLLQQMAHKGWNDEELIEAHQILEKKEGQHHFISNHINRWLKWVFFFQIIVGNIIVSATIIPLLILFPNPALYATIIVLGASFGFLIETVARHIDHELAAHHHLLLGVVIPALAGLSIILIVNYANPLLPHLIKTQRNPLLIGIIYGVSFALPYLAGKAAQMIK